MRFSPNFNLTWWVLLVVFHQTIVWAQTDSDGSYDLDLRVGTSQTPEQLIGLSFPLSITVVNEATSEAPAFDLGFVVTLPTGVAPSGGTLGLPTRTVANTTLGEVTYVYETDQVLEVGDSKGWSLTLTPNATYPADSQVVARVSVYGEDSPFERGVPPSFAPAGTPFGGVDYAATANAGTLASNTDNAPQTIANPIPTIASQFVATASTRLVLFDVLSDALVAEGERATGTGANSFLNRMTLVGNGIGAVESIVLTEILPSNREFLGFVDLPAGVTGVAEANSPTTGSTTLLLNVNTLAVNGLVDISYRSGITERTLTDARNEWTVGGTQGQRGIQGGTLVADGFESINQGAASTTSLSVLSARYNGATVGAGLLPEPVNERVETEYLAIQKSVSPGVVEISDTLLCTIDFQVSEYLDLVGPMTITDTLPDGTLFGGANTVSISTSAGNVLQFDATSGNPNPTTGDTEVRFTLIEGQRIPAGSTGRITFQFTVDNQFEGPGEQDFEASEILTNRVNTLATIGSDGNTDATILGRVTGDDSSATFTNPRPTIRNVLVSLTDARGVLYDGTSATPEYDANTVQIAAGSVLTFALIVENPNVPVLNLKVTDFLPLILGPNTAVRDITLNTNSDLVDIQGELIPVNDANGDGVADSSFNTLVGGNLGINPSFRQPNGLFFNIGNAAPKSTFSVLFTATVRDIKPEQLTAAGLIPNRNVGIGSYTNDQGVEQETFSDEQEFLVRSPFLIVNKEIVNPPATIDAGDTVTYRITLENTGTANAYVQDLLDKLPATLLLEDLASIRLTDASGTALPQGITASRGTDGTVSLRFSTEGTGIRSIVPFDDPATPLKESVVVIEYDTQVADTVVVGDTLQNTVTLNYYSAPNGGDNFGPLSDTTSIKVKSLVVDKTLASTNQAFTTGTDVAIGEEATYSIVITVPEGEISSMVVTDSIPSVMELLRVESVVVDSRILPATQAVSLLDSRLNDGIPDTLRVDFGKVRHPSTNTTPATVTIVYTTLMRNNNANLNGNRKRNTVTVTQGTKGSVTDFVDVFVREPILSIQKTISSSNADAGDALTYTITVSHAGNSRADAFDVNIRDILPPTMLFRSLGTVTPSTNFTGPVPTISGNGSNSTPVVLSPFDLKRGHTMRFTILVEVDGSTSGQQRITNVANGTWSTLDGEQPTERVKTADGTHILTLKSPKVVKSLVDSTVATTNGSTGTIGEVLTYELLVTVPEGTLENVTLTDTMETGLLFVGQTEFTTSPELNIAGSTTPIVTNGTKLTWDLGNIINSARTNSFNHTIRVRYRVVVQNTTLTNNQLVRENTAKLLHEVGSVEPAPIALKIVEPLLVLDKQLLTNPYYESGDALDFRLLVYHRAESASDAYDVSITDVLPSTVAWDGQVESNLQGLIVGTEELPTVKFTVAQLPSQYTEANPLEIRYRVSLTNTLKDGEVSTNSARMVWSSLPGNPSPIIPSDLTTGERVGNFANATDPVNDYLAEDDVSFSNGFLVAWEDLRSGKQTNDFDYNDLVLSVENAEIYNTNDELTSMSLKITPVARGALYDHEARLDLGIAGGASILVKRYSNTGTLLSEEVVQGTGFPIRKVVLFPSTQEVLPPWNGPANGFSSNTSSQQTADIATPAGYTTVEVLVNNPGLNPRIPDFPETRHLNEHNASLYGFSIFIKTTNQTVYLPWGFNAATYDIVTSANNPGSPLIGFPLTQAISVPVNWRHPFERTKVWVSHPLFVDHLFSGQTEFLDWAVDGTDSTRLWPKDKSKSAAKLSDTLDAVKVGIPVTGSPVIADLNANGVNEIVLGLFDGSIKIYEFSDDTLTSRTVTLEGIGESKGSVLVFNLDSDEELEMVRGDENGRVFFVDSDGSLLTQPIQLQGTIKSTPVSGDINGDGILEVVVQTGDGWLYAFDKAFLPLSGFPVNLGGSKDEGGHSYFTPSPVLASVSIGSQLDIITVNLSGTARIVSGSGATLPGWPVELNSETEASPLVLNVDSDAEPEIAFAGLDGFIHVLNHNGSIVPGWPVRRFFGGVSSPAAADVTGDGRDELFVGSSDGRIYGFTPEGTRLAGFPFFTGSAIHASPSIGNLDEDALPELLIASTDGKLYRVDFEGEKATSTVVCDFQTFAVTTTAIGSMNGDTLKLVLGTHTGELVIQDTGTQPSSDEVIWSGFRGRETGNALNGELPLLPTSSISAWGFY